MPSADSLGAFFARCLKGLALISAGAVWLVLLATIVLPLLLLGAALNSIGSWLLIAAHSIRNFLEDFAQSVEEKLNER